MQRFLRSLLVACTAATLVCACAEKSASPGEVADAAQRRQLLANLAEGVYLPTYEQFVVDAKALEAATAKYAKGLAEADRAAAREAYRTAMGQWERAELMQVGPANYASDQTPGGLGLRNDIYAYPLNFPCGIDRALVAKSYVDEKTLESATTESGRGLVALESLLFDERVATVCKATDSTVTSEAWAALVAGNLAQRRADYAHLLASSVRKRGEELVARWKDGFLDAFRKAGDGSKVFPNTSDALNAASDALFYLDTETKDMKLADPAGFSMTCMTIPCPERVEHPLAKVSKVSLIRNLEAFRDTFRGAPEASGKGMHGFYDLLVSVDAKDVGDEMNTLIDESLRELNAIDSTLEAALLAEDKQLRAAYDKLQALCDRLKTDFVVKLDLKKPSRVAGDND